MAITLLQTGEGKGVLPDEVILGRHVKVFHHKPDQGKRRDLNVKCKLFVPVWVKAIVFDDFGLLLVVVLLDTVDLYRYLGIHNGVFALVHLWQLLTRDYLWRKQRKRSGHH